MKKRRDQGRDIERRRGDNAGVGWRKGRRCSALHRRNGPLHLLLLLLLVVVLLVMRVLVLVLVRVLAVMLLLLSKERRRPLRTNRHTLIRTRDPPMRRRVRALVPRE